MNPVGESLSQSTEPTPISRLAVLGREYHRAGGRTVIGGGPRVGKTSLAARLEAIGIPVEHTDDLIGVFEWSALSEHVAHRMAEPSPWIWEGAATVRALRKALAMRPERPCDLLVWMRGAWVPLTPGQAGLAKGCESVLREIRPELVRRGVEILEVNP